MQHGKFEFVYITESMSQCGSLGYFNKIVKLILNGTALGARLRDKRNV